MNIEPHMMKTSDPLMLFIFHLLEVNDNNLPKG